MRSGDEPDGGAHGGPAEKPSPTEEMALKHTLPSASQPDVAAAAGGSTPAPVRTGSSSGPNRSTPGAAALRMKARATPAPDSGSKTPMPQVDALIDVTLAGRYKVTRKIGEGGMGAVYEAQHLLIGKRVAVKVLLEKYAEKQDIVARLQQEARLASSIGHPNIVDITDIDQTDDERTFVVMEFLEGESLAQLIHSEGPMDPPRLIRIAHQVADALAAAHEKGIVHRDIKPENVFITQRAGRDFVKVVDFGISKAMKTAQVEGEPETPRLTQTGMVLGTPLYMSPEQARGEDDLDHRIDVYALGVIMYESITGEVPFRGANYLAIISQVLGAEPKSPRDSRPDLSVTEALEAVILKAMAKDRERRYQSMRDLAADLSRLESGDLDGAKLRDSLSEPKSSSPSLRTLQARPRSKAKQALIVLAALTLLAGAGIGVLRALRSRAEADAGKSVAALTADTPQVAPLVLTVPRPDNGPQAPGNVKIAITTTPPGAEVFIGERKLGQSNGSFDVEHADKAVTLTFKLAGFDDESYTVTPDRDQPIEVELHAKKRGSSKLPVAALHKLPVGASVKPSPSAKPGGGNSASETKENPYVTKENPSK
jgi:eukaryotic-like serine/threonine-protein kinase